jgi:DNA-binding GntR family transcriptional regulator
VKKIRIPENLTTLAYKTIRDYIWEGRLDEGTRLTEEFLSRRLGISKSPIREALNRLESDGLIRIEPRRGAYLRSFSIKEIADLYDFREALEAHAVKTAQVTPELIEKLGQSVDRAKKFMKANDKLRYIDEDIHFHTLLAQSTGNDRLSKALENLQRLVWLFRRKTYDLSSSKAVVAHSAIVEALARHDKQNAERLMREHISGVGQKLIEFLESKEPEKTAKAV